MRGRPRAALAFPGLGTLRTNVYIDGFNVYYRCLKGTPYRWLDVARLAALLLPKHEINRIRYFTALVVERAPGSQTPLRQQIYLRALGTIPNLSIHLGHYLTHAVRMPLASPSPSGPRTVEVIKTEEKGSDVNLATFLLLDGFKRDFEQAVVISNDSDLRTPIEVVRHELGFPVGVVCPGDRPSVALRQVATFVRSIRRGALRASQFPPTLTDRNGAITKPPPW